MPRVVDHEERREAIAEATWRVISRAGPEGANMREIAREAGYTTGVVTHYFRDKRELMAFAFGLMVDRSMARVVGSSGPAEALAQLLPVDEQRRLEATVWLALVGASLADPELGRELRQRYRQAREATVPAFQTALKDAVPGENLDDFADELLAVVDGITVDALADPERYPPGRQLALLHRALDRLGLPTEGSP
jgi:TetR/AcrR family transcriptional repressor of bet genes